MISNKTYYTLTGLTIILAIISIVLAYRVFFPKDPVVAQYCDKTITESELREELLKRCGEDVLGDLLTEKIVSEALEKNAISVSDEEIALWAADYRKRPDAQEIIASGQLDEVKLRNNLKTSVPLYYLAVADIPEKEREEYFKKNKSRFEEVELKHILLGSEKEAEDLSKRIKGEDSFNVMASVHSIDEKSRDCSGSLGRVTRKELEDAFGKENADAIFNLKIDELSSPFESLGGGWHLFWVKSRATDYADLKRRVIEELAQKNLQKALEKLRDEANVKILTNFGQTSQADKEGKKPQEAKSSEVQEITVTESSPSPAQPAK